MATVRVFLPSPLLHATRVHHKGVGPLALMKQTMKRGIEKTQPIAGVDGWSLSCGDGKSTI